MDTNIAARFYRIDRASKIEPTFATCLHQLAGLSSDDDRERVVGDVRIVSSNYGNSNGLIWGDLLRLQNQNLPSLKVKGKVASNLVLPPGGHLGHHTAFLYDTQMRMLAFQIAHSTVGLSRFNAYVSDLCGCEPFEMVPVIKPDELKQLSNMHPRTFLIKVADPEDLEAVEDDQLEMQKSLVNLQRTMKGAYIKVQIGMGHHEHPLDTGFVRRSVGWLLEQHARTRGGVKAITLKGQTLDGKKTNPLNFLKAHVGTSSKIDLSNLTTISACERRIDFLKSSFDANRETLSNFVLKEL